MKQPYNRTENAIVPNEWPRGGERDGLFVIDREGFWYLLTQDDVDSGEHHESKREADRMQDRRAQTEEVEKWFE